MTARGRLLWPRARPEWLARVALALALAFIAGCGGGQTPGTAFDERWAYDRGKAIAEVQQKLASAPLPRGADVAVGVTEEDGERGERWLIGAPLGGGPAWRFAHALDARPAVAGTVVVGLGGGELFALEATTGRLLWSRAAGGRLRGAGDDGQTTVVSLMSRTDRGSVILAISHDGQVIRQLEDDEAIGVPAVAGRYAFLPWQGQYVTVFDLLTGEEVARALLRTEVSHAFLSGGALFFGGLAATRFDDRIRGAAEGRASTAMLPARDLPGEPRWMAPGTRVLRPGASAFDKNRLYARPAAEGPAGVAGGRFAATYFRVAVGFDAASGKLAWAHAGEADFIGGAAYEGGFALCDEAGEVTFLDAQRGARAARVSLGAKVTACVVQTDRTRVPPREAEPLWRQIERVVSVPEAELAAIQRFLLRDLAAMPEDEATRVLVLVARGERGSSALMDDARRALATRRTGAQYLLQALERRYDFLTGVLRPPPVGPLADALAAMNERRAAPLLAAHLLDPATLPEDVPRAAAALTTLAGSAELRALETFFAMYRGTDEEPLTAAAAEVARALWRLGASDVVKHAAEDPFTTGRLRDRLQALVNSPPAPQPAASAPR